MFENSRSLQIRVGFFVLIGFLLLGGMAVQFGQLGDGLKRYYTIHVEFPDASGLIKGANVLMAGAKIGIVGQKPEILKNMSGVTVPLQIYEGVRIPSASAMTIGSAGLLGDRFINVEVAPDGASSEPIPPGTVLKGARIRGMDDITAEAALLLADLRQAVKKVDGVITKIDSDVLGEKTIGDVTSTLSNLKTSSENFVKVSSSLEATLTDVRGVVKDVQSAAQTGDEALASAKAAMNEAQLAIKDVRGVIQKTQQGKGLIPRLLNDPSLAINLDALIQNLRNHGVIFYRDTASSSKKKP